MNPNETPPQELEILLYLAHSIVNDDEIDLDVLAWTLEPIDTWLKGVGTAHNNRSAADSSIDLFQWTDCVVILGKNPPRVATRAELVIEQHEGGKWGYMLHWWMPDGVHQADPYAANLDPDMAYNRSVHRLVWAGEDGMRGRHDYCPGDIAVVPLNRSR